MWNTNKNIVSQIKHPNICDIALKSTRKYCGKKQEEEKEKYKAFFKNEKGIFIIEKLIRDIIEHCKLPETIELRKKLGYNHDDIMVSEETSVINLWNKFDMCEINLHILKLREKNAANKVINKIAEDFEKIVAVTKLKELKRYATNILPNYKKWKTQNQK